MSDIREAFEAQMSDWGYQVDKGSDGGYLQTAVSTYWKVWQLGAKSQTAPAVPEAVHDLISGIRSINRANHHLVTVHGDDEPCYYQRAEWIQWILELADKAEAAAPQPDHSPDAGKVVQGENRYGLNMGYFRRLIAREFGDLSNFRPDEFARVCARMAATADASVLQEKEFHPAQPRNEVQAEALEAYARDLEQVHKSAKRQHANNTPAWYAGSFAKDARAAAARLRSNGG